MNDITCGYLFISRTRPNGQPSQPWTYEYIWAVCKSGPFRSPSCRWMTRGGAGGAWQLPCRTQLELFKRRISDQKWKTKQKLILDHCWVIHKNGRVWGEGEWKVKTLQSINSDFLSFLLILPFAFLEDPEGCNGMKLWFFSILSEFSTILLLFRTAINT
jgi:hypothetical protein